MNINSISPMSRAFSEAYISKLMEDFQLGLCDVSPWIFDGYKAFDASKTLDKTDPTISFVFDKSADQIDEWARADLLSLMTTLYNDTAVKFRPVFLDLTDEKKVRLTISCGELMCNDGEVLADKSTLDRDKVDMRNLFQASIYQALFEKAGVMSIEFQNFPLPFKPKRSKPIHYINSENKRCP